MGGEPQKNQDVKLDQMDHMTQDWWVGGWGVGVGVSKCQAVAKDSISHLSVGSVVGESQISEELALTRQAACGLIGQHT